MAFFDPKSVGVAEDVPVTLKGVFTETFDAHPSKRSNFDTFIPSIDFTQRVNHFDALVMLETFEQRAKYAGNGQIYRQNLAQAKSIAMELFEQGQSERMNVIVEPEDANIRLNWLPQNMRFISTKSKKIKHIILSELAKFFPSEVLVDFVHSRKRRPDFAVERKGYLLFVPFPGQEQCFQNLRANGYKVDPMREYDPTDPNEPRKWHTIYAQFFQRRQIRMYCLYNEIKLPMATARSAKWTKTTRQHILSMAPDLVPDFVKDIVRKEDTDANDNFDEESAFVSEVLKKPNQEALEQTLRDCVEYQDAQLKAYEQEHAGDDFETGIPSATPYEDEREKFRLVPSSSDWKIARFLSFHAITQFARDREWYSKITKTLRKVRLPRDYEGIEEGECWTEEAVLVKLCDIVYMAPRCFAAVVDVIRDYENHVQREVFSRKFRKRFFESGGAIDDEPFENVYQPITPGHVAIRDISKEYSIIQIVSPEYLDRVSAMLLDKRQEGQTFFIDTETGFLTKELALIQLANNRRGFVIDPLALGGTPEWARFTQALRQTKVLMFGLNFTNKEFGSITGFPSQNNVHDLREFLYQVTGIPEELALQPSLANFVSTYTGQFVSKCETISLWERRPLRVAQVRYAMLDVCGPILAFAEANHSRPNRFEHIREKFRNSRRPYFYSLENFSTQRHLPLVVKREDIVRGGEHFADDFTHGGEHYGDDDSDDYEELCDQAYRMDMEEKRESRMAQKSSSSSSVAKAPNVGGQPQMSAKNRRRMLKKTPLPPGRVDNVDDWEGYE